VAGVIGAVGGVLSRVAYGLRSAMGAAVRLPGRHIGLGRRRVAGLVAVWLADCMAIVLCMAGMASL